MHEDTVQDRWERLRQSLEHGGALSYLRRMARALAEIPQDDAVGARAFGLVNWHLWGEVARCLDDLDVLVKLGSVHPTRRGFEVRR